MAIDLTAYVTAYLVTVGSGNWAPADITAAIAAERRAQSQVCTIPTRRTVTAATVTGSAIVTAADGGTVLYLDDGRPVVGVGTFTYLDIGATVTGTGIPAATTVTTVSVDGTTATLSAVATGTGATATLTLDPDLSDLAEALARRVAANLANRNLPLGVATQVAEFGSTMTRVGGFDREVERFERPYRITL